MAISRAGGGWGPPASYAAPPPAPPTYYTTTFPSTENPISEGGVWTRLSTDLLDLQTASGRVYGKQNNSVDYDDSYALCTGSGVSFGNNMYAEATIRLAAGFSPAYNQEVELLLRGTHSVGSPGVRTWYECLHNIAGDFEIVYLTGINSGFTSLSLTTHTNAPIVDGQVMRAEISGSTISIYIDSVLKCQATDTNIASGGVPGIGMFSRGPVTDADKFCFRDYFKCGSL